MFWLFTLFPPFSPVSLFFLSFFLSFFFPFSLLFFLCLFLTYRVARHVICIFFPKVKRRARKKPDEEHETTPRTQRASLCFLFKKFSLQTTLRGP